jgi:hypothetical protein
VAHWKVHASHEESSSLLSKINWQDEKMKRGDTRKFLKIKDDKIKEFGEDKLAYKMAGFKIFENKIT